MLHRKGLVRSSTIFSTASVKSRRRALLGLCPLYPQKRTKSNATSMSALCQCGASLDHLVGDSEQPWREAEAECPGGVEVDHELELGRLHDRQVGGLLAFENPAGIDAGLALRVGDARPVAHQ